MKRYALPITSRSDVPRVTTWLWADHDGLHCGGQLPEGLVPTGHLWGWGDGVRVHLREDAVAPARGIAVWNSEQPGATEVFALPCTGDGFPTTVRDKDRFLRCASPEDQKRFDALRLDVLVVTSPTRAVMVGDATVA